jgi:hypothetical protein
VVPHLPPSGLRTKYVHAGQHYYAVKRTQRAWSDPEFEWQADTRIPKPAPSPLSLVLAAIALLTQKSPVLAGLEAEVAKGLQLVRTLIERSGDLSIRPVNTVLQGGTELAGAVVSETVATTTNVVEGVTRAVADAARNLPFVGHWIPEPPRPSKPRKFTAEPTDYTLADHLPSLYVATSQPNGKLTEFGDDF